ARLRGPRVPARASERGQRLARRRPSEVIAREEILVFVEQHGVAARVPRRRDDDEVSVEAHGVSALNYVLDAVARGVVVRVHDAASAEVARELFMVGHVVAVREEDRADAAHRFNLSDERAREARRINEDVAAPCFWPHDEITPRAETRLRVEAAVVDVLINLFGEGLDADARIVLPRRAD